MSGSRRAQPTVLLVVLTVAALSYALLQTMVLPALPTLRRDFDTSTSWVTWVLTGFLLSSAVLTGLLGKLGDQYGKERLLVVSLGVFGLGCVAAVFAWNIASLITFRVIQGAGGAVFPLAFAIIRDELPERRIGPAIGVVSSVFGVGGGAGILLAGVLLEHASWRWLFVVGGLLALTAMALVALCVPESPIKTPSRVDVPGALLFSGILVTLLLGLTEGTTWGWTSAGVLGLFAASAALAVAWVWVETRVPVPLIRMDVFVRPAVLFTNVASMIVGFALFGAFALLPTLVQVPRGLSAEVAAQVDYGLAASPVETGLYLLPSSLAMLLLAPVAGMVGRRIGFRWPLVYGMVMVAAGAALLAIYHGSGPQVAVSMLVLGTGAAFSFSVMPTLILQAVDANESGVATGMNNVVRTVGAVIGGQLGAAIVTSQQLPGLSVPAESGYVTAFWLTAAASLVGAAVALLIPGARSRPSALRWRAP